MDQPFELPVTYKEKDLLFPAQLIQLGYTHKFEVLVEDIAVYFERDEEGNYRALVDPETLPQHLEPALLQAISEAIKTILR